MRSHIYWIIFVTFSLVSNGQNAGESYQTYDSSWRSLEQYRCPDWFRDAKFGIWSCWNAYTVPANGDWYARNMYLQGSSANNYHVQNYGHPSEFGYKDIVDLWKGENFCPDSLVALFKESGAKYVVAMAVHHDNHDLWDSKYHQWNSVNYGPKKNIIRMWQEAVTKHGLYFGISSHLERTWNWFQTAHGSDAEGPFKGVPYDGANPAYSYVYPPKYGMNNTSPAYALKFPQQWIDEYTQRIKDLLTQHEPDFLYIDGGIPFGEQGRELVAWYYNSYRSWSDQDKDPVMTFKNFGHTDFHGDFRFGTCVEDIERGRMAGISPLPWQTDDSIGDWFWKENDHYISPEYFIHTLIDIVSKNGNLLMNVPLRADGTLDEKAITLLKEMGKWMKINGEGIYGTRPFTIFGEGPTDVKGGFFSPKANLTEKDFRFTAKGDTVFAFTMGALRDSVLIKTLKKGNYHNVKSIDILGMNDKIRFIQNRQGLTVTIPKDLPSEYSNCLRIIPEMD